MSNSSELQSRAKWRELGFRVPTKARPTAIEYFTPPGYRSVLRERHLFSQDQVVEIDSEQAKKRSEAACKAVMTRTENMERRAAESEIKIVRGKTNEEIFELALRTHGGNYLGDPGPFHWSNRAARNAIRHKLTNYEALWALCNRGYTGGGAYTILRERFDAVVDEAYPQFAEDMPEVEV
jgi:ribosomal protein L32E